MEPHRGQDQEPVQEMQQTGWERQLEDRDHVLDILNFTDNAISMLNKQNIHRITCIITTPMNIYDEIASQCRPAWTLTDTE